MKLNSKLIEQLIQKLEAVGLLQDLEFNDEDLADAIWLATHMGEISPQPEVKRKKKKRRSTKKETGTHLNTLDND